ncbi:type II secretion system protein GspM [Celerinatantimonas diazotrophica]|uniref:General secretion pathway protein M n=1 Tax=Celerinatantimonas diazotrophica TaxID=412034 RepID=A0A4R1KDQ5_9GAMM|nr:type II secretion system protein GspM [Celerinatantimonas diazotrophica]TCK62745.1 general secretion pathway protein M [Celerinatantimonas diazotrophica]CAG9298375.1 Type II secretion system protein M [Celerinatantimonas diazotrophica]
MKQWWYNLQSRERVMVSVGAVIVVLILLYQFGWVSYQNALVRSRAQLAQDQQTLNWVLAHRNKLKNPEQARSTIKSVPFSQAANQLAGALNISITRMQQSDNHYVLNIAPLPFNTLLEYIHRMQNQYGYQVIVLNLQAGEDGQVQVSQLQFKQG